MDSRYDSHVYEGYPYYAFVQKFEREFNHDHVMIWMRNNWHLSVYIAASYLALILALKEYTKKREPMKIRTAIMLWDFSLAAFSICGTLRALPEMFHVLTNYGFEFSMCDSTANSISAFWAWAFVFSKAFELVDTVFVVLKKQNLTFLHLAHHVLILLITWYYAVEAPGGVRWLTTMNYTIHSVMYAYFALKAVKVVVPPKVSMCITLAQIMQFSVGILASIYAIRANILGRPCTTKMHSSIAMACFSSLMFYLFLKYFIRRYNYFKLFHIKTKIY